MSTEREKRRNVTASTNQTITADTRFWFPALPAVLRESEQ